MSGRISGLEHLAIVDAATHMDLIAGNRFRRRRRLRDHSAPAYRRGVRPVDLNLLLHHHQLMLMLQDRAANREERRAYRQFTHDYFVRIKITRAQCGAPNAVCGFPT